MLFIIHISVKEKINRLLTILNKNFRLPFGEKLSSTVSSFTPKEQFVLIFLIILLSVSAFGLLWKVNQSFLVKVPTKGGAIVEGVVGPPRFINPLFAINQSHQMILYLLYKRHKTQPCEVREEQAGMV